MSLRASIARHPALWVALTLLVIGEVEQWTADGLWEPRWVTALLIPLWALPLAAGRLHPFAPLAGLAVIAAEALLVTERAPQLAAQILTLLAVSWTIGARARGRQLVGAAMVIEATVIVASAQGDAFASSVFFISILAAAALTAGLLVQRRTRRAEELRERSARLEAGALEESRRAIAQERTRIARELHDVVAHSVSVMTVQAGAARMMITSGRPQEARTALAAVEDTGREALTEMRRILGILRSDMGDAGLEPRPGLGNLTGLVAGACGAGQPVDLVVHGAPRELPAGADLAAYRVVQEALTNARKHSPGAPTHIVIDYRDGGVTLRIDNDPAPMPSAAEGSGQGLAGMRERLAIYNGSVEAGPRDDGGFTVAANIPLEAS